MSWMFEGAETSELPECVGFVYLITNNLSGRRYIGKKLSQFTKTSMKTITLKSGIKKKKKVKTMVESDWRTYWSSSTVLQKDVAELGQENFSREILFFCNSKGSLSYIEAREQFNNKVLEDVDQWYNGIISCRINRSHLTKHLKDLK
jgi:hypothetical protein